MIVVDASVALCWLMPDEYDDAAQKALEAVIAEQATVPGHFMLEVANALESCVKRKRITLKGADTALVRIFALPIEVAPTIPEARLADIVRVARAANLTIYDAVYLEHAQSRKLRLATRDRALAAAAMAHGVPLF